MSSVEEAFKHLIDGFGLRPSGILQIGAHEGQERFLFQSMNVPRVIFVEPNPVVFERLQNNIAGFSGYSALNNVITEKSDDEVCFNIASNEESSSILPLGRHGEIFPHIAYDRSITLVGRSVDSVIGSVHGADSIDTLVLDTQGSELLVLKGAREFLCRCRFIYTEASEIPLYEGGCSLQDLMSFLSDFGFGLKWAKMSRWKTGDVLFVRD